MYATGAKNPTNLSALSESSFCLYTGYVTPVKDQGDTCQSCVAFATMAVMETCFRIKTGRLGDYSEQELIDCAYEEQEGANGCEPTDGLTAYLDYAVRVRLLPASEEMYPYK